MNIRFFRQALIFLVLMMVASCSMEGVHHISVVNEHSNELEDIVVLPLYQSSYGIGIGPDGYGPKSSTKVFTKPFRFNSGEDLMSKQIQGSGIIIPPIIFIGRSNYVNSWLFIKKGYTPVLADRTQIYGESPIVMKRSNNEDNEEYIDLLLSKKPSQKELKKIFHANYLEGDIKLELHQNDVTLLNSIR